jgi:hypothetical protein
MFKFAGRLQGVRRIDSFDSPGIGWPADVVTKIEGEDMRRLLLWFALFSMFPISAGAVEIYGNFPDTIHPGERYVIYSHGFIAEGTDPRPVSPKYGLYDFPALKQAIFNDGGFNLIAYQRPKNTDIAAYVKTLESWVHRLVQAGVAPSRITLVGFSRGSLLTAYASSDLASLGINTALLAICDHGDIERDPPGPPLMLGGNLLTIYETSDIYGSCAKLAARSHLSSFKEIAISTGKAHGAFFQPRPEWVQPLKAWIEKTNR